MTSVSTTSAKNRSVPCPEEFEGEDDPRGDEGDQDNKELFRLDFDTLNLGIDRTLTASTNFGISSTSVPSPKRKLQKKRRMPHGKPNIAGIAFSETTSLNSILGKIAINDTNDTNGGRTAGEQQVNVLSTINSNEFGEAEDQFDMPFKSGYEAVNFFANHPNDPNLKFAYFNRAETCDDFRPYDLVAVPHKNLNQQEHFTISSRGVVHLKLDGSSEFIPLAKWSHESTIYDLLTSMHTFKHYLLMKMFRFWRSNVRYKLFLKTRNRLNRNLFLTKNSFRSALLKVNEIINEIQEVKLMNIKSEKYRIEGFMKDQTSQAVEAGKELEEIIDRLQAMLEQVVYEVKDRCQNAAEQLNNSEDCLKTKNKSIVLLKELRASRKRTLRQCRFEVEMLPKFMILSDYMTAESLGELMVRANQQFLKLLRTPKRNGLFSTTASFRGHEDGIHFTTTPQDIHENVKKITSNLISSLESLPRVLCMRALKELISPLDGSVDLSASKDAKRPENEVSSTDRIRSGLKIVEIIKNSRQFIEDSKEVEITIERDFELVKVKAKDLQVFRKVYTFGQTWNFEEYAQIERSVEDIQKELVFHRHELQLIERNMRNGFVTGIFYVDNRELKTKLLPICKDAINDLKSLALQDFHEKCVQLSQMLRDKLNCLDPDFSDLQTFSEFVSRLKSVKNEEKSKISDLTEELEALHSLLRSYQVKIPPEDLIHFDDLRQIRVSFEAKLSQTEENIQPKIPFYCKLVDEEVAKILVKLEEINPALNEDVFLSETTSPKIALSLLAEIEDKLNELSTEVTKLNEYRLLFQAEPFQLTMLSEASKDFKMKCEFWEMYRQWEVDSISWLSSNFLDLDVEEMSSKVARYYKRVYEIAKLTKDSSAAAERLAVKLKDEILHWKSQMPVILKLSNKAMLESHWTKLFKNVGGILKDGQLLNLGLFKDLGLLDQIELVGEIVAQAVEMERQRDREGN